MKKLSIIFGLVLILALMTTPAFPISFQFDFDGDKDWDTDYTLDSIGDTMQVDLYIDSTSENNGLYTAGVVFSYDERKLAVDDYWANDNEHGGPWPPDYTSVTPIEGGFEVSCMRLAGCTFELDGKYLLASFVLRAKGGDSQIDATQLTGSETYNCSSGVPIIPDDADATIYGPCGVFIDPTSAEVEFGKTIQFSASSSGNCGETPSYSWEVTPDCGSNIDAGFYTAGDVISDCSDTVTVTDTNNGNIQDTATVNISPPPCQVTISPEFATVLASYNIQFNATSEYCGNEPLYTWEISSRESSGSTINSKGLYKAGNKSGKDTVTAYDEANEVDATATVVVVTTTTTVRVTTTTPPTTTTTIPGCVTDEDCDDGNPCTDDSCNAIGLCEYNNNTDPCDDGLFCTLTDICQDGECVGSGDPCPPDVECDEENDRCLPTMVPLLFTLTPDSALRSHLIPLPLFMLIVSDDPGTKFDRTSTEVSFDVALTPPLTLVLSEDLIFTFSLILPSGLGVTGSTEVTVTVNTTMNGEEGTGDEILTLNMLPFILDQEKNLI